MTPSEGTERLPEAPSAAQMDRLTSVVMPMARITQPRLYGIENLPDRGALYVGNHTIYSFLDLPFMMAELWRRRRIVLRGLGDHGHYAVPVWRDLLQLGGMVRGTRENVRDLMAHGQNVLVFPGGAEEVFKRRGEKYKLLWKERLGFARLAIEFGYPIVPFAAVGAEEMLEVVVDERTPVLRQVSGLMRRLIGLPMPPIARGIGPTVLPRPERLYFWFGPPIDTMRFAGRAEDDDAVRLLRDEVRAAVEGGISYLLAERSTDPDRALVARLRRGADEPALAGPADPRASFVERAFEAWNTAGAAGAAAWLSPDVVLEDPPDWPDRDIWRGRDTVLARLEDVTSTLGGKWAEVGDARSADGKVIGSMTLHAGVGGSGRGIGDFHFVCEIEEEQISHMRIFRTRDEARAAAKGESKAGSAHNRVAMTAE